MIILSACNKLESRIDASVLEPRFPHRIYDNVYMRHLLFGMNERLSAQPAKKHALFNKFSASASATL